MTKINFANWFVGFTDGEGSFKLHLSPSKIKRKLFPEFSITQRADDVLLLCKIRESLKMGGIYYFSNKNRINLYSRLTISGNMDCLELVKFFRQYPLRSRQGKVFKIWAEVVEANIRGETIDCDNYLNMLYAARRFSAGWVEIKRKAESLISIYISQNKKKRRERNKLSHQGCVSGNRKVEPLKLLGLIDKPISLSEVGQIALKEMGYSRAVTYQWIKRFIRAGYLFVSVIDKRQQSLTRTEKKFTDNPLDWSK